MPVYFGNLRVSEINRLDQIQYRAAKIVTGALHMSSKIKLNVGLGWESLKVMYECLGLSLFHKIHLGCTQPLVKTFMPQLEVHHYNTRVSVKYKNFPYVNKQYSLSFYPYFTKLWNNTHNTLQSERDLLEYKGKLKNMYKHPKYKFYYRGLTKRGSSLMTHLRVGRSVLNDHAFPLGFLSSPQCLCHSPRESPGHIILSCFLYTRERLTLMGKVENIIPKILNFNIPRPPL